MRASRVSDLNKKKKSRRAAIFAHSLCKQARRLTAAHFEEEARYGSIAYHLLEGFDLSRFHRPRPGELPLNEPGVAVWRLRPKDRRTAEEIDGIVLPAIFRSCGRVCVVGGHENLRAGEIRYRYVLAADTHAHTGEIVICGGHVKRALNARRRRWNNFGQDA